MHHWLWHSSLPKDVRARVSQYFHRRSQLGIKWGLLDLLVHNTSSALFPRCLSAILWFLFVAVVKTGLTVHLDFSSAISCEEGGGRLGESVGDVLKLPHNEEGCHHHCNQFRLEKLHPRALHLYRAGICCIETKTFCASIFPRELSSLTPIGTTLSVTMRFIFGVLRGMSLFFSG